MGQLRDINGVVIGMQAYPHTKGSTLTVNVNQRMRADTDEIIELLRELDLHFDITEAKKCIALGRFTASVMHLMRALEAPLKALASDLGVQGERQNWGDLINNIEPKINAMPNNSPHKATYSESAIQFRFIKNAWRNHAMHSREKYTAEEANIILIATKALMKSLSGTLHE